ncbi:thermonuclease family protein [Planctomicrobium sp. SH668]|uniref:thermonuclease family protein n=1 Tax=Planctomicrobium sp. SH668 TaxID=3448126 RepID=UPI003F5C11EC
MRAKFLFVALVAIQTYTTGFAAGEIPRIERVDQGKVVAVTNGDTVNVLIDRTEVKVRLEGIDAPERKQAFGSQAKQHLSDLVFGETVQLHVTGKDRYRRILGTLVSDGVDINLQMITGGMAWHYEYYNSEKRYAAAQVEAKEAKRGLWADPMPLPPWEFRKRK